MANPIRRLTDSVPSWGAKLAHGESSVMGGRELVPVALVFFGFGGGEGSGAWPEGRTTASGHGDGSGGGGGGYVVPIGAYVGGPSGVTFRPNPVALMTAAVPLLLAAGWAVARVITATQGDRAAS